MDQSGWIIAETELEKLTEKQTVKSRAVQECGKIQLERIEITETVEELEHREQQTPAVHADLSNFGCMGHWRRCRPLAKSFLIQDCQKFF